MTRHATTGRRLATPAPRQFSNDGDHRPGAVIDRRLHRTSWVTLALATAVSIGGCTLKEQEPPPLAGPSELGVSLSMSATPDVLMQDGVSQSQVAVMARNADSAPIGGMDLRVETLVDGALIDIGRLSSKNVQTGSRRSRRGDVHGAARSRDRQLRARRDSRHHPDDARRHRLLDRRRPNHRDPAHAAGAHRGAAGNAVRELHVRPEDRHRRPGRPVRRLGIA